MDGLRVTGREQEVLGLVAGHLTNAEIADRLVLSVRTVESHVSSLMRKLGTADRRALARRAEALGLTRPKTSAWPRMASSFVGRERELGEVRALLGAHRLVTLTGPGGVGKTRLALQAVEDGWFVDLSGLADGQGVVAAVAQTVGVSERPGSTLEGGLVDSLQDVEGVLVLDNCEHVLPAVTALVTSLLRGTKLLTVVATSRAPLRTPDEWVFETPPLSAPDGVHLFRSRAQAAGGTVPDDERAREFCARLEHMPLAVELAAARYPVLGMDGLSIGLADPLRLLGSGRGRSLRATIDWSVGLLDAASRRTFAALGVFAGPFSAESALAVAGPDGSLVEMTAKLATLSDQHLLSAVPDIPTTYRFQEVVRQYAVEMLAEEATEVAARHAAWVAAELSQLAAQEATDSWCHRVDAVALEARAVLARDQHPALGEALAEQLVRRGLLEESQHLFERLAADSEGSERIRLLRLAAGAAAARLVGDETMHLLDEAGEAASPEEAADALAWSVIFAAYHPGMMATQPTDDDVISRLERARALAPRGSRAEVAVATASAMLLPGSGLEVTAAAREAADRAAELGLPLLASAALDCVCSSQLSRGDFESALATVAERGAQMDPLPLSAATAYPFNDYLLMGCEVSLAAGELGQAVAYAERLESLPCYRDHAHPALARRLQVDALLEDLTGAVARADRFLISWERAGRHPAATLAVGAYAAAYVHGALGDEEARALWQQVTLDLLGGQVRTAVGWAPTLDAMLLLRQGKPTEALEALEAPFDDPQWDLSTTLQMWRPWYAATWAEAAVLSGIADPEAAIAAARGNKVAEERVARAVNMCS